MSVALLEKENTELKQEVVKLKIRNEQLLEELRIALHKKFGNSSETMPGQPDLDFEELESVDTAETVQDDSITIEAHDRKKAGRKALADNLPRTDIFHDLEDHEKICGCGHHMKKIGEDLTERLMMVPRKVWVDRHHQAKYACAHCEGLSDESRGAVVTAKAPEALIPRSFATPELMAHILIAKFCDHLPYHRQEVGFRRIGVELSRQTMSNWTITMAQQLEPLILEIEKHILQEPVIQMDETPVKVLEMADKPEGGKGYMWLMRGGGTGPPGKVAVRYRFAPTRGSVHAKFYLDRFQGSFVQCDGYQAYDTALKGNKDITQVGCWAHARRKFFDANKASKSALMKDAIGRIQKLYELEKMVRKKAKNDGLDDAGLTQEREAILKPFLENQKKWFFEMAPRVLPESPAGKAFAYTLGQWDKLDKFWMHPQLTPDNNLAENSIRPFVLGRKNWLFHGNEKGAEASCRIFTLIETAKTNGIEPFAYMSDLLNKLPETRSTGDWKALLPWNLIPGKN